MSGCQPILFWEAGIWKQIIQGWRLSDLIGIRCGKKAQYVIVFHFRHLGRAAKLLLTLLASWEKAWSDGSVSENITLSNPWWMSLDIKHQWLPTSEKSGPGTTCSCDKGFKLCLIQSAVCKSTGRRDVLNCTTNAQPAKLDRGTLGHVSWVLFFFLIFKNLFGCAGSSLLHVGSNSLTRNWTQVLCSSGLVSYPVHHQGSFYPGSFSRWIVKGRMEWRRNPVG